MVFGLWSLWDPNSWSWLVFSPRSNFQHRSPASVYMQGPYFPLQLPENTHLLDSWSKLDSSYCLWRTTSWGGGKKFASEARLVWISSESLISCVTLDKLLTLSGLPISYLHHGNNNHTHFMGFWWGVNGHWLWSSLHKDWYTGGAKVISELFCFCFFRVF